MSPRHDHRGPAVAFGVLFLVAVLVMGNQMLARAVGATTYLAFDRAPQVLLAVRPAPRDVRPAEAAPAVPPLLATVARPRPAGDATTAGQPAAAAPRAHLRPAVRPGAQHREPRLGRSTVHRVAERIAGPTVHPAHRSFARHSAAPAAARHRVSPQGAARSARRHPAGHDGARLHHAHRPAGHAFRRAHAHHAHHAKGGHRR